MKEPILDVTIKLNFRPCICKGKFKIKIGNILGIQDKMIASFTCLECFLKASQRVPLLIVDIDK